MLKTLYIFLQLSVGRHGCKEKKKKSTLACISIIFVKKAKQFNKMGTPFVSGSLVEIRYPLLHKDFQLTGDLPHCSTVQTRYQHLLPRRLRGDRVCILQCPTRCDLTANGNGYNYICIKYTVCQYFTSKLTVKSKLIMGHKHKTLFLTTKSSKRS